MPPAHLGAGYAGAHCTWLLEPCELGAVGVTKTNEQWLMVSVRASSEDGNMHTTGPHRGEVAKDYEGGNPTTGVSLDCVHICVRLLVCICMCGGVHVNTQRAFLKTR